MNHFKLRDYQSNVINDVLLHLQTNNRCCVSLATGGGKTVIFTNLLNQLQGRTLILVHREELVYQTSTTLKVDHDILIPKIKRISKNVCVAMVQTLKNRVKKGLIDINDFDNIIVDEAHRGEFMILLDDFLGKLIGFTATPNYEKVRYFYKCLACGGESDLNEDCCKRKPKKYKESVPLSKYYHHLIHGIEINELIEKGYLVPDDNFEIEIDTSRLVYDERIQDFTEESIGIVFGSDEALENTYNTYIQLALNKKTIIFNPNTLINRKLYELMMQKDLPVKMYDSKNSEENRHELVEWFKNTNNAILLNVQVFTTGFDCTDVEVIFLNKKTASINLFLQMVGRGGRITDKILKPSFKVIDMGNNIKDLGKWSDVRDWNQYFYRSEVKTVGTSTPAVRSCHQCESIIAANSLFCEVCGAERLYIGGVSSGLPKRDGKLIIPKPNQIVEYCESKDLECLEARKIVYNYVAEMFIETKEETFINKYKSGELFYRTKKFITPYYFAISKSNLKGNKCRTLDSFTNETLKQVQRFYEDRRQYTS
jgi:superfamily II DNA or RNA helicase